LDPEELAQQQQILEATIASILPRLQDFTNLLVNSLIKLVLFVADKSERFVSNEPFRGSG
jgi:hypothetical protein